MTQEWADGIEPAMLALGEVALVDRGSGPALLLLHGNGRTWQDWLPQLQTLPDRFRCIAYDQRGFGESTLNEDLLSLVQLADDAAGVLHRLGIEHAYVAGISMGAQVAQILAQRYPHRVDGIVLGGSPYLPADAELPQGQEVIADLGSMDDEQLRAYAEASIGRLKQGGTTSQESTQTERDAVFEQFREMRDDPAVARLSRRRMCPEDLRRLQDYEHLDVPTLLVHGEADMLPVDGAVQMSRRIPGAQLAVLPGGGHIANGEPTAALFDQAVVEFIATRSSAGFSRSSCEPRSSGDAQAQHP
ncbi:alpha/beta hydrolase [Saccharopolyspora sp. HNM0983]|uniref:Alpha/beta hydrolase n=1 Tax=Saccharopolyspora montiporae TaxID=2781240 RepID=A0A929G2U0_9PSEU|nr:alpha/beta hydrolase [Saccharopolyspora sp. HNM0983]MBE9376178.1 alpha/beta hydrolase [Saccharopolyspora sp. HNM0983]